MIGWQYYAISLGVFYGGIWRPLEEETQLELIGKNEIKPRTLGTQVIISPTQWLQIGAMKASLGNHIHICWWDVITDSRPNLCVDLVKPPQSWRYGCVNTWWYHRMETFSALLAFCAGSSPVTGEFPSQGPVTRSFDVFFDPRLNKRLSKQSRRRWFETPSRSLWHLCNACHILVGLMSYLYPELGGWLSQSSLMKHVPYYQVHVLRLLIKTFG